jgi:hypothetical protein
MNTSSFVWCTTKWIPTVLHMKMCSLHVLKPALITRVSEWQQIWFQISGSGQSRYSADTGRALVVNLTKINEPRTRP